MGLFHSLTGLLTVQLTSADLSAALTQIAQMNVQLLEVQFQDELTCHATVHQRDYGRLRKVVLHRGDQLRIIKKKGIYYSARTLNRRPVLIIGAVVFLLLAVFLPTRVLFIQIEGNTSIPTRHILEVASNCGVSFFSSRREIRSEKVKNALLEQMPELQWIGVNTAGCVATISVKEKSTAEQITKPLESVGSIVASRDGVIWECTVIRGNPVCKVGQAVKAGQVLVSGYTDCGISIRATRAEAEVYAQTLRELEAVAMTNYRQRGDEISKETKYSLIIGKKRINFYKDSGICDAGCVKMYKEYYVTLPGGFTLPVGIIQYTNIRYSMTGLEVTQKEADWMYLSAEEYLNSRMVAGIIKNRNASVELGDEICVLKGKYACLEMIGQFKPEMFIQR
jgi:sporulation protein YqfD